MDIIEAKERLKILINEISAIHRSICKLWIDYASMENIVIFNQKSEKINELMKDKKFNVIFDYIGFLNNHEEIKSVEQNFKKDFVVDSRIKSSNSILEKCDDYCNYANHKGKVPVNKCLNDLFGIRVIIDCPNLLLSDIEDCIVGRDDVKIKDKSFDEGCSSSKYIAAHIYFLGYGTKEDKNKVFR